MKRKDESLFEMFQDPIMTMIAVLLLMTLWMILPGESRTGTPREHERREAADSLGRVVQDVDKEINLQEIQLRRMKRELDWTTEKLAGMSEEERRVAAKGAGSVEEDAEQMRSKTQRMKEELDRLEATLEAARKKAVHSSGGEGIRSVEDAIRENSGALQKNMEALAQTARDRQAAESEYRSRQSQEEKLRQLQSDLAQELAAKQERRRNVERQIADLDKSKPSPGKGFSVYKETNKKIFYVRLAKGRLLPVDNIHYSVRNGYLTMKNGQTVSASEKEPFGSATWDAADRIGQAGSEYIRALSKIDAAEYCVYFLVDRYSFDLFRRARQIARDKGFDIGWDPNEDEKIVLIDKDFGKPPIVNPFSGG